ncbi:1563_t:CDS:10 [Diversispora eburnea]|uniref:1563_t:CDS:1 n=1 Tax=Diversispora eburnea TaxID=1213867 RepID=A0A9N8V0K1_9GLOM|nr:1563_t:CDS:10 [Diversispora eburnea]
MSNFIEEKVRFSDHKLTIDNDIRLNSLTNINRPQVWAMTRQELCETVPYFRSWHGGVYNKNGVVWGYLLDGFGALRDVCNGRVIISHGGGKSYKRNDGNFGLVASQMLTDVSVRSLLKNYLNKQPLALIVGNKKHAKFRIPARYCVLGLYLITHVWPEYEYYSVPMDEGNITDEECIIDANLPNNHNNSSRENGKTSFIRWKFRFEWVPNQEFLPWWESPCENLINSTILMSELISIVCPECGLPSNKIYANSWICLNHNCKHFWQSLSDDFIWEDVPENLDYVKSFLSPGLIDMNQIIRIPFSILPAQPPNDSDNLIGLSFSSQHWKGYHCLRCGRISCRSSWKEWVCANYLPLLIGPAKDYDTCIKSGSQITVSRNVAPDGAIICRYDFPEGGYIIHRLGNFSLNAVSDELFRILQNRDIPFKRNIVKSGSLRVGSELLSRNFTMNIGTNYKFSLAVDTLQFNQCPEVLYSTFLYLTEMCSQLVPGAQFNEMLAVAYLKNQKVIILVILEKIDLLIIIDDGEKGVAPIIGNLSLGSSAMIMFRKKKTKASNSITEEKIFFSNSQVTMNTEKKRKTSNSQVNKNIIVKDCSLSLRNRRYLKTTLDQSEDIIDIAVTEKNEKLRARKKKASCSRKKTGFINSTPQADSNASNTLSSSASEKLNSRETNVVKLPLPPVNSTETINQETFSEFPSNTLAPIDTFNTKKNSPLPPISTLGFDLGDSNTKKIPNTTTPLIINSNSAPYRGLPVDHMKLDLNFRGNGPDLVLKLNHGDILLMVGKNIQTYYEHAVNPEGFRIAATIRHISEE